MTNTTRKGVYSPYDISRLCQESVETVYNWIYRKEIPSFQVPGGHLRIQHDDLEKFVQERHYSVFFDHDKPFEKYRVLAVEDDQDLLDIVAQLLHEDPRLEIRTEDRGFSAGLQVISWHPDLILLDFLMPGMSGFEVCKVLRGNPEIRDIPVLAMTSLATPENRRAVMEAGVSDFLGKPFHSDEFLQKIRNLLGIPAEVRTLPSTPSSPQNL